MRNAFLKRMLLTFLFLLLTALILTDSQTSLALAQSSLNLWFTKMIPSLLPFMILSGIMVRLHLTESFASLLRPALWFWRVRKNVIYAMFMGFLCGFPMGAKVTCDLLDQGGITKEEADFLLAFCNNIGPVYFLSFVIPTLHRRLTAPYLFGMYGLPFLYGLFLRHTFYRHRLPEGERASFAAQRPKNNLSVLSQIDDSVSSAVRSILMLGGYMILFNLLNLFPYGLRRFADAAVCRGLPEAVRCRIDSLPALLAPVLEITGGLGALRDSNPLLAFLLLPFGGFCCAAQTYSIIRHTELSLSSYLLHKLALTGLTALYYWSWWVCFPQTFLH